MDTVLKRQSEIQTDIKVAGTDDWSVCLSNIIPFEGYWARKLGKNEGTELELTTLWAELQKLSHVFGIVTSFLNRGFMLEELEIEYVDSRAAWGVCTWCKGHPEYLRRFEKDYPDKEPTGYENLMYAMYKTEHAGEKNACFFSGSMLIGLFVKGSSMIPNKAIVFRRVVFSPPAERKEAEAA